MRFNSIGIVIVSLVLGPTLGTAFAFASQADVDAIQQEIDKRGAKWKAGKTSISELSSEEKGKRIGLMKDDGLPPGLSKVHASKKPGVDPITSAAASTSSTSSGSDALLAAAPAALDWRNYNGYSYVTPVKNQGSCGSCWAFSSAAALESQVLMGQSLFTDESEQILVSCDTISLGCGGGYISTAGDLMMNPGLPAESYYPYTATNGSCSNAATGWQNYTQKILNWAYSYPISTASTIENLLTTYGPVVATMDVYQDFDYYTSGIYKHISGSYRGGHAVLVVGYDHANEYFIVKNSWGTGWGEQGYIKIGYSEITSPVKFGLSTFYYTTSNSPPVIALSAPNGGESYYGGSTAQIKWSYAGSPGSTVNIDLLKGGATVKQIASGVSIGSNGSGSYNWAIPTGEAAGTDYRVTVSSVSSPNISSTSGGDFQIALLPAAPTASNLSAVLSTVTKGRKTTTMVKLSWTSSYSPGGVSGYRIFRNGAQIATSTKISYSDTGTVAGGGTYTYTVQAYDSYSQVSPMSNSASVNR